ncbi:S-adenosyl-L-methionine-dependent methyltransferase [Karstenula rhodostoma CBS 690.94]|uniref:S-adenosyl-L-methionine-dependent methyltransferase n=1 Tax=Karstenula rhodostoma CBS 690.94 TaxID=1392251 RepID=A0A9P4PJ56_9PLEO|nr:S-adenosyl-L-methionine-dependent methyltransferase [Karstenula rhodostoma CBS 690.94]
MDAFIPQIRTLYAKSDEQTRQKIQRDLRDLQASFDNEWDLVIRLASGSVQMPLVKTGNDLSLFTTLSSSKDPLTLSTLATSTSAAPKMLFHLLRDMAAFGLIDQTSADTFAANRTTHIFADVHVSGSISHVYDVLLPSIYALPAWLAEHKYGEITDNKNLSFHKALKTDLEPFEWMKQHPEQMESLGHAMAIQREVHWVDSYPVAAAIGDYKAAADSAVLVDIGGGFGQQALAFKNKVVGTEGRIVVQDVQATLKSAPKVEGLEFQEHDFFNEQPIKGAKLYYLRNILHDWTDEDSIRILNAIVPALGPDPRIVIDEVVLPDAQLPWQAAWMDLVMMSSLGGVERTKLEFETLLDTAGLRIIEVHRYDARMQSVIIAAPK